MHANFSRTRSTAAALAMAMGLSLVVAPAATADPPPAEPAAGPYVDQRLDGDPECNEIAFPGSRTLAAQRGQTFVATRGELRHLHLCMTGGAFAGTNDFTVRIREVATEGDPVEDDVIGFQQHRARVGTGWNVVDLGTVAMLEPGRPYRIEVSGPLVNGQPLSVENVSWRLSCSPGILANCVEADDRYGDGTAVTNGGPIADNSDFGFRTATQFRADLVTDFTKVPRHVCPGLEVPFTITAGDVGGGTVGASTVEMRLEGPGGEAVPVATFEVPALTPNEVIDLSQAITIPESFTGDLGRARFSLTANAGNEVVEATANQANNQVDADAQTIVTDCAASDISEITVAADRPTVPAGVGTLPIEALVEEPNLRFLRPIASLPGASAANGPSAYNPINPNGPSAYNPTNPNGPSAYNPTDANGPSAYNPTDPNGPSAYNPTDPNGPSAYNPTDPNGPSAYNPTDPNGPSAYNPLAGSPMQAAPLNAVPVDRSAVLHDAPGNARSFLFGIPTAVLEAIPLQALPLTRPGGWAWFLEEYRESTSTPDPLAFEPIQNLTLLDVMAFDPVPQNPILHSHLDADGSILGDFTVLATSLGATRLRDLPAPDQSWCDVAAQAAIECREVGGNVELRVDGSWQAESTLVTLDALGAPLELIDVDRVASADHPGYTLDSVALSPSAPLSAVQLALSQPVAPNTPWNSPLFDPRGTALAAVSVDDAAWADVLICPIGCSGTLGEAYEASRVRPDSAQYDPNDSRYSPTASLGQVLALVPADVRPLVTIEDLVLGVTNDRRSLPWEHADLDGLLLAETALRVDPDKGGLVTFTATITADALGAGLVDPTVDIVLPVTFAAQDGSATITAETDPEASLRTTTASSADAATAQVVSFDTDLHLAPGETAVVAIRANPGVVLGDHAAAATALGTDVLGDVYEATSADDATVTVVERPVGSSVDDAPVLETDTLAFGHLKAGDRDLWRVPVPLDPNWEVRITLSHVDIDADLVVGAAVRDAILGNGPSAYNPFAVPNGPSAYNPTDPNGPSAYNPHTDPNGPSAYNPNPQPAIQPESAADWDATGDARDLPPQLLEDVPTDGPAFDKGVRAYSISRGPTVADAEEVAILVTEAEDGFYNVQVTGYNDASSQSYYVLRYHVIGAPRIDLGECRPLPWQPLASSLVLPTSASAPDVDPETNTLFLVADGRIAGREGEAARTATLAKLDELAGRADLGVRGLVLGVDGDPDVAAAYAQWDQARCDVHAANLVSGRIRDLVMGYSLQFPIENVVIVGDDDMIAHMRFRDGATQGNERAFTSFVVDQIADSSGRNNTPTTAALEAGMFLTDDHFGTPQARAWGDQGIFIPTMAVGRLAGTATAIIAAIDDFIGTEGQVDSDVIAPADGVGTGYAHNLDGGVATSNELESSLGIELTRFESEAWTAAQLGAAIGTASSGVDPTVLSLNGHSDHQRFLSALGNQTHQLSELIDTSSVGALPSGSIVFSMGCHFGYDLPEGLTAPGGSAIHTWRDAVDARLGILVANTGFNYGDTTEVGAGELFSAYFARNLDGSMTVGQASAMAKALTFALEQGMERERLKALQGMVFYGLPMYRIAGTGANAASGAVAPAPLVAPTGQLSTHSMTMDFGFGVRSADGGQVFDLTSATSSLGAPVDMATLSLAGRPVGPMGVVDVTDLLDDPSLEFRGAVVTDLESTDLTNFDPVFANTVVGRADDGRVRESLGIFPLDQASVRTVQTVLGRRTYLTVLPWTFRSTDDDGTVTGDLRLDDTVVLDLLVAPKTAWDGVHIEKVEVDRSTLNGVGELAIDVVTRATGADATEGTIATYRDAVTGQWHMATPTASQSLPNGRIAWTLTGQYPASSQPTELLVSAWSASGVSALWRNKGDLVDFLPPGKLDFEVDGVPGRNGWYVTPVTIGLPPLAPGETYLVRPAPGLEPVPFEGSDYVVAEDGIRVLGFVSPDGSTVEGIRIKLDQAATAPEVTNPEAGMYAFGTALMMEFTCPEDIPSGTASCVGALDGEPIEVGTVVTPREGMHELVVTSTDHAGNVATTIRPFTILPPPLEFRGFYWPVKNTKFNVVPIDSDDDDHGDDDDGDDDNDGAFRRVIFAWHLLRDGKVVRDTALVDAPRWQQVTCTSSISAATPIGPSVAATSPYGVRVWWYGIMWYKADIPTTTRNTCWRFDLGLENGETKSAFFKFIDD